MIDNLWQAFKGAFLTPARVVPFVMSVGYTVLAAANVWLAEHLTFLPTFTTDQLWALFGGTVLGGIAHVLHWRSGWQKYETEKRG